MGWTIVMLLAGVVCVGEAIYEVVHQRRLRREGIHAPGRVVRHRTGSIPRGGGTYYVAVVAFLDAYGNSHEFEAKVSGVKGLPVGGHAPVVYLPSAPKSARIDSLAQRRERIVGLLLFSVVFLGLGTWLLATGR